MSTNKYNISQIRKYLNGELDARAMYKLEREAQSDPFLMDAIRGMESGNEDHQPNLDAIDRMIKERVERDKRRVIPLYRYWAAAACLLIALGIGGWWLTRPTIKPLLAVNTKIATPVAKPDSAVPVTASVKETKPPVVAKLAPVSAIASNEPLKKMPGANVDSSSNITSQGQAVTKVRLNGKDYAGGNVQQAVKALPADILEKTQVVDDYGDQAARTGVKDGNPAKVLNITTDTASKKKLIAAYGFIKPDNALHEVKINDKSLEGKVAGLSVNQAAPAMVSTRTITGSVVDNSGQPLIGATVTVKGNQQSIQTNTDGAFTITVPATSETLDVRYIGYTSQQVKIGNQNNFKIALDANQNSLSEVVVVGYGAQKRRDITGSVSSVTAQPDTTANKNAHPAIGMKAYEQYLKENALITDGKTGTVNLIFTVSPTGAISNIKIEKSLNDELDQKAINLILNGPKWIDGGKSKEVRLKIVFHKKGF